MHLKLALSIFGALLLIQHVNAADFKPYAADWMLPPSGNVTYDNFLWTTHPGGNPWYILSGARSGGLSSATLNINNDFYMTVNGSLFQMAQTNKITSATGTVNIHGNAYIQNGAQFRGASTTLGKGSGTVRANLTIDGTLYLSDGGYISGGYTSNVGSGNYIANFNINNVIIENEGIWDTPGINNQSNKFTFTASLNNVTVKDKGTFTHSSGNSALSSTIEIKDTLTLENGATFKNNGGLIVGAKQTNRVNIEKTLNLSGGTITDCTSLTQNTGLINVTNGKYDFSNFVQTDGQLLNSGNLSFNGADVETKGSLINYGTLSFSGKSDIDKVISGTGVFNVTGGTFTGVNVDGASSANFSEGATAHVDRLNTFTITNGANLSVGDLVQYIGATYIQTAGQISVDSEWFQNSTLNIEGGILKRNNVGRNTVNLSGGVVEVATLTSDNRYNVTGGELKTDIEQVFYDLQGTTPSDLSYVSILATTPQEIQISISEWFQEYFAGNVREELSSFVSFQGGKVVVCNADLTETQRDDLTTAFKETFGSGTTIEFQGTISGVSKNDVLNTAKVNELSDKAGLTDVIYVDRALEGENSAVVIGDAGVKNSTGFTSINDAASINVKDGKNLVLIGFKDSAKQMTDGVKVEGSGTGSKVTLGTKGLADGASYQGLIEAMFLSGGAGLDVVNGTYTVSDLTLRGSTSVATVAEGAKLNSDSIILNTAASLTNNGELTVSGGIEGTGLANVTNAKGATLRVTGDSSLIGNFTNSGYAQLGNFETNGSFTNNDGATIDMNTLRVLGTLNNYGELNAKDDSFVNGTLTNTGTIRLYNTTIAEGRGHINNTHTIDAEGTITMNGLLTNVDNADLEALTISGSNALVENTGTLSATDKENTSETGVVTVTNGGTLANSGSLVLDKLVVSDGGYQINGAVGDYGGVLRLGMKRAPATEQIRELDVQEGTQKTNNGIGYYGQGTIAGTFTNATGAEAFGGISSIYVDGQGLTITSTGHIQNGGTFTMGGTMSNAGTIDGDGTLVLQREAAASNVFTNSGTISVGNLTAENITYTQTAGSTAATNGWFTNATVNVQGGSMSHDTMGVGNTYTVGKSGDVNAGATLSFDTLTSDSVVNIVDGGTLVASDIDLTKDEKTVHLQGGTLQTYLKEIFNDVFYKTLDIDAENPDDTVDIEGIKVATGVSDVLDSIAKGIEFGWGTVAFNDGSYSASMAADVLEKLDAIDTDPSGHEGQLEVTFNGEAAQAFNVDMANQVIAKDGNGQLTYATFANEVLTNAVEPDSGYTKLFVGKEGSSSILMQSDANVLSTSIGFKGIEGVSDGVYVADGHHLVLVGEKQSVAGSENFAMTDGNIYISGISGQTSADTVSTLTLGSYGTTEKTTGKLKAIYVAVHPDNQDGSTGSGVLRVRHGDFVADALYNGGTTYIGGNGENGLRQDTDVSLTVDTLQINGGDLFNYGTLSATTTGSGSLQQSVTNYGTMNLGEVDSNDNFTNHGTLTAGNVTLRTGGMLYPTFENPNEPSDEREFGATTVNKAGAEMTLGSLTLTGWADILNGAYRNGGMINEGTLEITNALTVDGDFRNTGDSAQATIGQLVMKSEVAENIVARFENLNGATATIDSLDTTAGTIQNEGILNLTQTNGASSLGSVLTNEGTLNTSESTNAFAIATNGQLVNTGTVNASGTIEVSGGTFENSGKVELNGLTVTAGQVLVNEGSSFKDSGKTTIAMASGTDVAISNSSTLNLAELELTKGTIEGGTLNTTSGSVGADGVLKNIANFIGKITSAGSIISDIATTITGTVTNTGTADYDQDVTIVTGGRLDNQGTMTGENVIVNAGGSLASSGDTTITQTTAAKDAVIEVSGGTLHTGSLVADGAIYNQTGGTIKSDNGWFVNSTLNISGGTLNTSDIDGGSLGKNVVNISGANPMPTIDNDDSTDIKSQWKDGLTVVTADVVTSDTTINIASGGVLDVEDLQLTGTDSITLAGGGLQTSLGDFFDYVKTEAIKIDAENPETGSVEVPTEVLVSTTVGDVQDSIVEGINMESGMVAFDDEFISQSTIVSAGIQFGEAFADAANVTLHFLGSLASDFTIDTAQELIDEGLSQVLHGIVLDTTTLHNTSLASGDTNKDLVVGGTASGANSIGAGEDGFKGIGFQNVANAQNVTITGGQELALVGTVRPENFDWTTGYDDSNKLLLDSTDGGTVNVDNGTFTLGSDGVRNPTVGWVNSSTIGQEGHLVVKNGEFADWTINNSGEVLVKDNAILHTNTFTNAGELNIGGEMTIVSLDNANGTVTNTGSLTLTGTSDLTGTILNGGSLTAVGNVSVSGDYTSDSDSINNFDNLTVTSDNMVNGGALTITALADGATDDTFALTIATGGKLTNQGGTLTNTSHDTLVNGTLINNGKAYYDDMTIASGATSENSVYEKGDWLTVSSGGTHTNTGVSIWNGLTVTGSFENLGTNEDSGLVIGSEDISGSFDIEGSFTNGSQLDATNVENTEVSGSLTNTVDGVANYDDMTIHNGGSSDNAGYEKGDILTVEQGGSHNNTGTSIWNNAQIAGSSENGESGNVDFNGKFDVVAGGEYTNNGQLDATDTPMTNVGGQLTNEETGKAHYDDMTIAEGGTSTNNGYEEGDILDVDGKWEQNGESHWNNIVLGSETGETTFGADSQTETDKITVNGGSLIVDGGNFTATDAELTDGVFVVGNHETLGEDNKVDFTLTNPGTINTSTWVIGNGNLAFGSTTDFDSEVGMPELPDHPSRVTVGSTVTIGENGSLAVGSDVWTDRDNHLDIANGDLYFATDSTTLIDASSLGTDTPAFNAGLDGAKVTVEDGATLVLGNIKVNGTYLITEGFTTAGNTDGESWIGGWTADNLYALPQSGSGLGWILDMNYDDDSIWVSAVLEDVQNVYPDIVLPENINDNNRHPEYDNVDDNWIDSVLTDQNHGIEDKTTVINSVAEIGLASSSLALAIGELNTATDSVENRVSMVGEAFNSDGYMLRGRMGHSLWVDVLASNRQADDYQADGNREIGYDASSYGFIMGYDYLLENRDVLVGGAFSFQKGSSDSEGNVLKTSNDHDTFGLHAYAAWSPSPKLNVIGSLSYMRNSAEVEQGLPFGNRNEAKADIDTDMITAGVRAESTVKVTENVKVVPHFGIRVVHADQGSYDTKLDGEKAFNNDTDASTLVQFPIGVAVRMDKQLDNGWNVRPHADLTVIPQAGDTEQTISVTGTHGVTDDVSGDFSGKFNTQMTLGIQADKGKSTFGARYGFGVGGDGKQDHQFKIEFRHQF